MDLFYLEEELVQIERLGDILGGALLHGLDGRTDAAEAGDDDHFHVRSLLFCLLEEFQAREAGHLDVGDQKVKAVVLYLLQGVQTVVRSNRFVTVLVESVEEVLQRYLFVLCYENIE